MSVDKIQWHNWQSDLFEVSVADGIRSTVQPRAHSTNALLLGCYFVPTRGLTIGTLILFLFHCN